MRFAAIHFLYNLAHQSLATVFVLYTGYRYGWTPTDVGWALASVGVSSAIIQAGLVGRLVAEVRRVAHAHRGLVVRRHRHGDLRHRAHRP